MQIELSTVIYICTAIASISGATAIVCRIVKNVISRTTRSAIEEAMINNQQKFTAQMNSMQNTFDDHIKANGENTDIIKEALKSIIRDRINQAHINYVQSGKNIIGTYSLSALENLYQVYKKLGGNSFIEKEMQDLRELEIVSTEEVISKEK